MTTLIIFLIVIAFIGAFSEWRVYQYSLQSIEYRDKHNQVVERFNNLLTLSKEAVLDYEILLEILEENFTEAQLDNMIAEKHKERDEFDA